MSTNAPMTFHAAHEDASRFNARIDLKNIGEAEARKIMSEEHKALGYRPPPGSLAAEAQAEAAKHPEAKTTVSENLLSKAAVEDAAKIRNERGKQGIDLSAIGEDGARKLMSEEHKILGHRPPSSSLAAHAQAAAAKHPLGAASASAQPDIHELQRAALEDAAQIESVASEIDLEYIGESEARKLMSEEHKALGYRPPQGSLAAAAQAAAAKHPGANAGVDSATLTKAALEDAQKIEQTRRTSASQSPVEKLNLSTLTTDEARAVQSEEQRTLGYRPPANSLAAQAQSAVDSRSDETVTKQTAAKMQSVEHKALGHRPESGSAAAVAQSVADKNENDGGSRTFAEAGL
ncbi:hypothetical protein BDW22DRAFT_1363833 [Trametopsis cervina]|nr:hypothetical protein BDW22DRAFT_1363833 [Trametopsis cervina]